MGLCYQCEKWDPLNNRCDGAPIRKVSEITACDKFSKYSCADEEEKTQDDVTANDPTTNDPVNSPNHYVGKIECIDYLRDKLTPAEFTGFCMGNVLKYCSRWRKKDGVQDLHKAKVYLEWAIENEEKRT